MDAISFDAFNKAYHGFALYLSQGGEVFDPQQFATGDDFIKRLDELMYANKLQNKLERHTKKASA